MKVLLVTACGCMRSADVERCGLYVEIPMLPRQDLTVRPNEVPRPLRYLTRTFEYDFTDRNGMRVYAEVLRC